MKHPSIRLRLMLGTGLIVAILLLIANVAIYRAFERTLSKEVEQQLLQSASLLAKSAELEADGLVYEWQEAMESPDASDITGVFQFWDMNSGKSTKSPDLGDGELPRFYGKLNHPVLRDIVLKDGRHARAVGLLHYPFTDEITIAEAAKAGKILHPENFPQVVVCARETESLAHRLSELRTHLTRAAIATLLAIWASIFAISAWCLRPIREFSDNLLERSEKENPPVVEIPHAMPSELVGLAAAFNTTLDRVEKSRAREKEFALHAAHELRTPVAGILATLEQALHRPRDSEDLSNRIGEALKITSGMRLTLDSLMRLARLRGGLETSLKASFDPLAAVTDLLANATAIIARRRLRPTKDFPEKTGPLFNDPGLFRAVISNLIDNAVRHSPRNSVFHFQITDTPDHFSFRTKNATGGLKPEDLGRLFEPFQRASDAADDEGGHAGLGLSLAREAVILLGGNLRAEINSDDGTVIFTTTILKR
jgi:two-component system heavy metal sensor histidine kinase CusS